MKVELVTLDDAKNLGLVVSRLLHEGHGAFGEADNSYEYVVCVGHKTIRVSDDDFILFTGKTPNREVIQVINMWQCSDKFLEILNPKLLLKRKKEKFEQYLKLKKEIESYGFL